MYRKTRLMVLDAMIRCAARLHHVVVEPCIGEEVEVLTDGIIASIPYHLTHIPELSIPSSEGDLRCSSPGKTIGGLLLMHPLFVVSSLSSVSQQKRTHLRGCLKWIGIHMGVGQASQLALVGFFVVR